VTKTGLTAAQLRVGVAVAAVAALAATLLVLVPQAQVADLSVDAAERFKAEDEARRTLVQLFGGLALLFGLWLTLREVRASEQTAASSLGGQVTERFGRAIEHLSSAHLVTRLGGIYALERIARDSAPDHWTVVEVLLAFIRDAVPAKGCHEARYSASEPAPPPGADVQAALTVVGRRNAERDGDRILDLARTDLRGADFRGLDYRKAHFLGACLQSANFTAAQLQEADFSAASLLSVCLTDANLDDANLITARTGGTYCHRTSLRGTKVSEDNLKGLDGLSDDQRSQLVVAHWHVWPGTG
jgi:hypothetical protein